jgi:hypothetical protein
VNWRENIAHLGFGLAGIALARTATSAWLYFIVGGLIYLVLTIYGFAIDVRSSANILGVNEAGNWLQAVIFVPMIGVGGVLGRQAREAGR